jgi:LacI family transcriptional regulator
MTVTAASTSTEARPIVSAAEIARQCGVSQQAVSYAIRGRGRLGAETRQRIIKTAREMGYQPNAVARNMRAGKFRAIGLLIGSSTPNYLPTELVLGLERSLARTGEHLIFTRIPDEQLLADGFMPRVLEESSVDGLIIHYTHEFPAQMRELIDRYRIPCIWVNTKLPDDCIYPDEVAGGRLGTEALLAAGHRKIAFVNLAGGGHFSEIDRRLGYEQAMHDAGLEPRIVESGVRLRDLPAGDDPRHGLAVELLRGDDRPTAVVSYEMTTTMPLLFAAAELGIVVPKDLSVVSFGRTAVTESGRPVSLLRVPLAEIGRASVEMTQTKINQPHVRLETRTLQYDAPTKATIAAPSP